MTNRPVSGNYIQGNPATHPGVPVGKDRVPAWLAPNEFVVNAEATQMYGPQIEAMNNHGRAVQQAAGAPPVMPDVQYFAGGGFVDMLASMFGGGVAPTAPANPGPEVMTQVPDMQAPPAPAPSADIFSGDNWARYADTVSSIESGGFKDPYSIYGGYNNHYVGKYQLGAEAISDAAGFLGMESTPSREAVRQDPALQERLFNAFTQNNHRSLLGRSEEYRSMDPAAQQRTLGYAHNQGAGATAKFLRTKVAGSDGWGTSGLKYSNALGKAQGDPHWTPQLSTMTSAQVEQMYPVGSWSEEVPGQKYPIDTAEWMGLSMGQPVPDQEVAAVNTHPPVFSPTTRVFADPAYKMMADRSGLGAQGYWDSLHPKAQEQHVKRVGAPPAIYTDQSEMDVLNRVGANSGFAAIPADYNLAQTNFGREGMPAEMAVPTQDMLPPQMPGVDAAPNMAMPGQLEVPGMDAKPIDPEAQKNAHRQYAESRAEADYQSQQELDRITLQLQTTTRDAPAYEFLQQRRAQLLQNLGRTDPSFTGSSIPNPEALGTDILTNQNKAVNAEAEVAAQTQAIQDAAARGDISAVTAADAALTAARQQRAATQTEAEDMSRIRRENAVEDQARQNSAIQLEVAGLDTAIAGATTPEGAAALTQARDAKVAQMDIPPMPPAGQTADGIPSIDDTVPPAPATPPTEAEVETKIAEAEATVEPGDTVLETTPTDAVEAAGAQAVAEDPSALSGAFSSLKSFFGDMFDIDELKRMAILYVGARVTGAGHGSSLAFAGKSYLSRLGAKEQAYKDAATSGDYTRESLADFKRSDDPADLRKVTVPPIATGIITTRWNGDGEPVSLEKYTHPNGSASWVDMNGRTVDPRSLSEKEPKSAYDVRRAIEADILPGATEFYETNGKRIDTKSSKPGKPGKLVNKVQVGPVTIVQQAARFAQVNGYNVEDLDRTGILNNAMMDMFNDKSPGAKNDITPYLEMNNMRFESSQREGMFAIGTNDNGSATMVSPSVLQVVNAVVVAEVRDTPGNENLSKQEILTQVYSAAWADYNDNSKVSADERKQWQKKSSDDTNGFIEYFKSLAE